MKLKVTYDSKNNQRMYREDENGKEYVYYCDKKQRVIIRDFFEEDAVPWSNAMLSSFGFDAKKKNSCLKTYYEIIRNRKEDDLEFSLIVTSLTGKVLGELVFSPATNEEGYGAIVKIFVKNEITLKAMGKAIITALYNLQQKYHFYDRLYVEDEQGGTKELNLQTA